MARLAFFNLPAHGHVNPTLPVVTELIRRGESVLYYNSEEFRQAIERTGSQFRGYNPPVDEDAGQSAANFLRLTAVLLESSLDLLPNLLDDLEKDPVDYVIHDSVCPWGRFVAEVLGLPAVASNTLFALTSEMFLPQNPLAKLWAIPSALLKDLRSLRRVRRARRHLDTVYGLTKTRAFDVLSNRAPLNVVYTAREFQPRLELFDDSYKFVGPSLASRGGEREFSRELGDGPVIYVSLGTIFNESLDFYRTCLKALGGSEQRVVMSVSRKIDISQLGAIPSNFLVRHWVPQLLVLSKANLFLTRCGMNSVNESLYHGVPMLLFPEIMEQKLVAAQVSSAGAGVILDERKVKAEDLRRHVQGVLGHPKFQQAARRVGASLRAAGGYERAADEILRYRASEVPNRGNPGRTR